MSEDVLFPVPVVVDEPDRFQTSELRLDTRRNKTDTGSIPSPSEITPKQFLEKLGAFISTSPFRPKPRGGISMRRHFPDREKNYVFGKPSQLKDVPQFD